MFLVFENVEPVLSLLMAYQHQSWQTRSWKWPKKDVCIEIYRIRQSHHKLYVILSSMCYIYIYHSNMSTDTHRICVVMVSVLASSVIDRGFEPWLGQTKDYKIGICCFSAKHGIIIMCQSGATYLSVDCCFSEIAL